MRVIILALALTGLLTSCAKSSIDTGAQSVDEVSAVKVGAVESIISETERLKLWFDERFEEKLSRSPMWMTSLGRKDKYDQIDDHSEAEQAKDLQWFAATVDELSTNFKYEALSEEAKISYDIWVYQYESDRAMAPFRRNEYVFTRISSPQSALPAFLINYHTVEDESDMRAYITRIAGISRAMDQLLDRAKAGAAEGVRPPQFAYKGALSEARSQLDGAPFSTEGLQDAPLWVDAQAKVEALRSAGEIDDAGAAQLAESAKAALLGSFEPAYSRLISWFEADIENSAIDAKGVGALPNGEAYYNASLMRRTTLPVTAAELHQTGLQEVARLLGEMETIKQRVGFKGTLKEFFNFIKTDKQFYYANDEEGRQRYIDDTNDHFNFINDKLPEYFGILPKADLIVKRVEAYREQDGGGAFYNPSTPDGTRPGVYYLHLSDMNANPNSELEYIAYHEGNPGHHMETAIGQELTGVPMFRTQAFFNSYSEGWALYAEFLAKEMGAYQDPYSDFGRLTGEIWRAIRLVVDTGIHSMSWTEQQAIAYCASNSPANDATIKSEIQRYFVWPGQATSYKVGMLKIQALRKKAEDELGDKFDIRKFHDTVLGGGPVPLSIMERVVNNWIEKTKMGNL